MKTLVFLIMTSMLPITLGYQTTAGAPIVTVKISDDLKVDKSYQGAVEVKVKKSNGQPVANKLVEVSAVTNTATLISKRALTNSKGIATFDLNTGAASGVFSLKATIDGKEYDTEQLSEAAREQLASIQLVDQKLAQLQQEAAILQTARNAYAQALQAELPKES